MEGGLLLYVREGGGGGGCLSLYVREDIPAKEVACKSLSHIECILIEINMHARKWLIYGIYNPDNSLISNHLSHLNRSLEYYTQHNDDIILLGDFNAGMQDVNLNDFCSLYNFKNLIKEPTCYKNPLNPSCIDLIITNRPNSFQDTNGIEAGLSDFHKLTISLMKMFLKKQRPKIISYRDYKKYSPAVFRIELQEALTYFDLCSISNDQFVQVVTSIFNIHAPIKFKYIRANDSPFINTELRKAMLRLKLRNSNHKNKTLHAHLACKRQRNYCISLLRESKKKFYGRLDPSVILDNKKFWKVTKPFFSNKVTVSNSITLSDNNEIHNDSSKVSTI